MTIIYILLVLAGIMLINSFIVIMRDREEKKKIKK